MVVHPYRTPAPPPTAKPAERPNEEKFLIALLVGVGGLGVFAAGSNVALIMLVLGLAWALCW